MSRQTCVLPGYERAPESEQKKALVNINRRLFDTDDGRVVLNELLTDLFFFRETNSPAEAALAEYAKYFVRERLGITNTFELTNAMMKTISDRKD